MMEGQGPAGRDGYGSFGTAAHAARRHREAMKI